MLGLGHPSLVVAAFAFTYLVQLFATFRWKCFLQLIVSLQHQQLQAHLLGNKGKTESRPKEKQLPRSLKVHYRASTS